MRHFLFLLVPAAVVFAAQPAAAPLTARQVIERIQKHSGVPWNSATVDTFKTGNPDTPVTGVATTFAATFDVLRRAAASGKNLIITHEPTFYSHEDRTAPLEKDPVYRAKRDFIDKHGMVIFRFHDHWHAMKPDGILTGVVETIGWTSFLRPGGAPVFAVPATTLESMASELKARLKIRAVRVIGDPQLKVSKAALLPGAAGSDQQMRLLEREDVEVLIIGETREWETVEYVRDAAAEGKHKALIILGHVPSEEVGMANCARWLKGFVTEVPVEFIPAGEPYWPAK